MQKTTSRKNIYRESIKEFLTPIRSLLENPDVSEILINGPNCVFFEEKGRLKPASDECKFPSNRLLGAAAINIAEYVNRQLDRYLFEFRVTKADAAGKLSGELQWTGYRPGFIPEVYSQGWADQIE